VPQLGGHLCGFLRNFWTSMRDSEVQRRNGAVALLDVASGAETRFVQSPRYGRFLPVSAVSCSLHSYAPMPKRAGIPVSLVAVSTQTLGNMSRSARSQERVLSSESYRAISTSSPANALIAPPRVPEGRLELRLPDT
jgi:hypothetical protein